MEKLPIKQLIKNHHLDGQVEWIGLRPARKEALLAVEKVSINLSEGLVGDHFTAKYSKKRQITLIQQEHLETVARLMGMREINPTLVRRNIVISKINILTLKDQKFKIGDVILKGTGYCHPCSRMEENLGVGGYNAMRGHGGITASVIQEGIITIGDKVSLLT